MSRPVSDIGAPWKRDLRQRLQNAFLSGNDYEAPFRPTVINMKWAGMSLSASVSAIKDIDRLKQSLDLVRRASAKLEDPEVKPIIESPLTGLSFLRDAIGRSQRLTPQGAPMPTRRQRRGR
jgi:hypothetical protein